MVAVKIINTNQMAPKKLLRIKQEAEILSSLNHPYIIPFIDFYTDKYHMYLVMDLMDMDLG